MVTPGAGAGTAIGEAPASPAPPRPPLPLLFVITITGILHNTLLQPAIPDVLADFGAGDGMAGVLVASGTAAGVLAAPVIGILADRYGRRAVLLPCLVTFGVFGTLQTLASSFEVFLLLRFLQGVGGAGLMNLAVTLIGDHWSGLSRARALGQNAAVLTVSLAVFPPIGGWLTELGSWRYALAPYSVSLLTAAVIWRYLPAARPERGEVGAQLREAFHHIRHPTVLAAFGMGFVIFFLIFGLFLTALPIHLEQEFGLDAGARGLVIAVPAASSTIAALAIGRLRSRWAIRPLLLTSWLILAVSFAAIGAAPEIWMLLVGAFLYGLGEGIVIPSLQDIVTGAAPPAHRSAVVAAFVGVLRLGQTAGPLAAGALLAASSTAVPFEAGAALAGLSLLFLLGRTRIAGRRHPATVPS